MIPTRFALAVCLLVPSLAAHSQTADRPATVKVSATEFRAISTGKLATFEKELSELAGQGFRLERLLESFTIFYQAALLSRQQTEGGAAKYEYKLLTTRRVSTLEKELEAAAAEGCQLLHLSARMRCRWSLRFQVSYLTLLLRRTNRFGPVDFLPRIFTEVEAHRH